MAGDGGKGRNDVSGPSIKRHQSDDLRSWRFHWAGHVLAAILCSLFVGVYSVSSYQRDGWRGYFFKNTLSLADACAVAAVASDSPERPSEWPAAAYRAVSIPHAGDLLRSMTAGGGVYTHAHYRCRLQAADLHSAKGSVYLHTGWIFADRTQIFVNGSLRSSFNGNDKPAIILTLDDQSKAGLTFDIFVSGPRSFARLGLVGAQPAVVAVGAASNASILSIEATLQTTGYLYELLPSMTLALVLIFGWFYGIRLRLMLSAFFFFVFTALRTIVPLFTNLWPWSLDQSLLVQIPLNMAAGFAFLVFGLELLGLAKRAIYPLMMLIALAVPALLVALSASPDPFASIPVLLSFYRAACIAGGLGLSIAGVFTIKATTPDLERRRIYVAFLILCSFFSLAMAVDLLFVQLGVNVRLSHYIDILMPLFIGGVLFFALAAIEKNYQLERITRLSLVERLELGRAAQSLLLPKDLGGQFAEYEFQSFYRPSQQMSGDWLNHWRLNDGECRLILGDVSGKGPQAALTAAVISAVINDCKKTEPSMEECIARINRDLLELFGQNTATTVSAVVLKPGGKAAVYNCGNSGWIHYSQGIAHHHRPLGSLLGILPTLVIGVEELQLAPGDLLFAYTDGVCDGPRALRRLLLSLQDNVAELSQFDAVFARALAAGRDNECDDDQSMIVVRAAA